MDYRAKCYRDRHRPPSRVGVYALAAAIAIAAIAFVSIASFVHGEEVIPLKWKVIVTIIDHDEPIRFTYGNPQTGPVYFVSEAECKDALENDPVFGKILDILKEKAKANNAVYDGAICVTSL